MSRFEVGSAPRLTPELDSIVTGLGLDSAQTWTGRRAGSAMSSWLVLPSARRPQLLVPATRSGSRVVAQRMAGGRRAKVIRWGMATVMRGGLAPLLPVTHLMTDDERVADLARWMTGRDDLVLAFLFGPDRANRKPVVRAMAPDGRTVAYGKLGTNDLTRDLVRREHENLADLATAELSTITLPKVLKYGVWAGHQILVTSALAEDELHRHPQALPVAATRELMDLGSLSDQRLGDFLKRMEETPAPADEQRAERIIECRRRLSALVGDLEVGMGAAHGDWTPWNMAGVGHCLEVWDWERFQTAVPQGLDVVHFVLSSRGPHSDVPDAELVAELSTSLRQCAKDPALAEALLCVYLLMMAQRYAADLEIHHAGAVENRFQWVLGKLSRHMDALEGGDQS